MVQFSTRLPDTRLLPYIKMYFWGKDENPPKVQRIVPNGEMGLCVYRGTPVIYDGEGERWSCLSGQSLRYQDIVSHGKIEIVGAHFTTLGARLFFRLALHELFGQTVELTDLRDQGMKDMAERIQEAIDPQACWNLMDKFFLERLAESEENQLDFRRLQRALAYGQQHTSDMRIGEIASEVCLSERQFCRVFSDWTGLSPKDYIRLLRYHKTLHELKQVGRSSQKSFLEIAWENGYYDYSHLSSDFRKISGYPPHRLLEISANDGDEVGWRL